MNLLLTSIGKRIQLITHLKTKFRVVGADASLLNPAKNFVDSFHLIPRCREEGYVDALLSICKEEKIDLLIPLYEPEFPYLNQAREQFEEIGVHLILCTGPVLDICNDKIKTAKFFEKYHIPAPKTLGDDEIQTILKREYFYLDENGEFMFPFIIKPLDGMGSEGVFRVKNPKEFEFFYSYVKNPIVQRCASGEEYTIDALCDLEGNVVYSVPRLRLEVRSGEVTKSRTVKQRAVIAETVRLLQELNKEGTVIGPMTIQCFLEDDGDSVQFIEINSRFGGGVPLSFEAGADYATALEKMCMGKGPLFLSNSDWKELTMMRYDQAVYEE